MMQRPGSAVMAAAVLGLLALGLPAQRADVRVRRGHTTTIDSYKSVTIRREGLSGVEARKGAERFRWPVDRIIEISYRKAPTAWKTGLTAYKDGEFETAARSFTKALAVAGRYPWLTAYANWFAGEAHRKLGDFKDAQANFDALTRLSPPSRFLMGALVSSASMAMIMGDGKEARKDYERLLDLARRQHLPQKYQDQAQVGLALVEARFGDAEKGLNKLMQIQSSTESAAIKNQCALAIGETYIRKKAFKRALAYFKGIEERLDREHPDPELIAGAANGLADCQRHMGRNKQASLTYSRVYALFLDRMDLRIQVAHALYYGGLAFEALAGQAKDAEQKKLLNRRARKLYRRVFRDFPGTRGASLAKKKIG